MTAEGQLANVSGAVLLGGNSTRMGDLGDKAHLELDGVAFATLIARRLDRFCSEVLLVGGNPPDDAPGRRVPDEPGPHCALRGIATALAESSAPRVLIVATDLPLVSSEVLLALLAWPEADAIAVTDREGRAQPLCAIYRREPALAAAREAFSQGDLSLRAWLAGLDPQQIGGGDLSALDRHGMALTNVNTPQDLETVAAIRASDG